MTRSIIPVALIAAGVGCTTPPAVGVPNQLRPAADESVALTAPARGVQVYECRAGKDGAGFAWTFVAPDAELFDAKSHSIGRHGAGPTWQANDGSRVVATVRARADAPVAGAIPWLLLNAQSTGTAGAFSGITSIQRINTVGGVAPTVPCTAGLSGTTVRVRYTADYIFFSR